MKMTTSKRRHRENNLPIIARLPVKCQGKTHQIIVTEDGRYATVHHDPKEIQRQLDFIKLGDTVNDTGCWQFSMFLEDFLSRIRLKPTAADIAAAMEGFYGAKKAGAFMKKGAGFRKIRGQFYSNWSFLRPFICKLFRDACHLDSSIGIRTRKLTNHRVISIQLKKEGSMIMAPMWIESDWMFSVFFPGLSIIGDNLTSFVSPLPKEGDIFIRQLRQTQVMNGTLYYQQRFVHVRGTGRGKGYELIA